MTAAAYPWIRRLRRLMHSRVQPGTLHTLENVVSPELGISRDVHVYLPPGYAEEVRRYPVVYMHDAQNLFQSGKGMFGSWHVEEAVVTAARLGYPAIVVGIPHAGTERIVELSPFDDASFGSGRGEPYLDFITGTVKPCVDRQFRTLRDRGSTGIVGSSMGGLISMYAAFTRPDTFGFVGAMSPSLWFAHEAIFPIVERALQALDDPERPRVYLDIGRHEGERALRDARRMRDLLVAHGYRPGENMRWIEDARGGHNEAAWARRFRKVLPVLLASDGVNAMMRTAEMRRPTLDELRQGREVAQ